MQNPSESSLKCGSENPLPAPNFGVTSGISNLQRSRSSINNAFYCQWVYRIEILYISFNVFMMLQYWFITQSTHFFVVIMSNDALFFAIRSRFVRYILLKWSSANIVAEIHCAFFTMYQIRNNMFFYDFSFRFIFRSVNVFKKIIVATRNSLKKYLEKQSWIYQKKMMWFLWKKWNIFVHQSTIFKFIKRIQWNNKKNQRIDHRRDDDFRLHWIANFLHVIVEQMMCVNEILFNEMINWRHRTYVFIEQFARYHVDRKRKIFWNVFSVYIIWNEFHYSLKSNSWLISMNRLFALYRHQKKLIQIRRFLRMITIRFIIVMRRLFCSQKRYYYEQRQYSL